MNKEQALQDFFESFTWKAYDESTVPDDAEIPRITYSVATDSLDTTLSMTCSLWDKSYSWESVTLKAKEIAQRLYTMHPPAIAFDTGRIYITPGTPFAQRFTEQSDDTIRRILINFEVEYFSAY